MRSGAELSAVKSSAGQPPEESPEPKLSGAQQRALEGVPPLFETGQCIAERYVILRFVDRGGVGEVYEVEDQELKERVALKVLRQDDATLENIERFKREINLARQVTHPNVCRIYEFGQEIRPRGHFFFLTMELLNGESLYDRIRRLGPMAPAEALPLVRQMAEGLEAAQRAGVIHRDFKSSNVVLVDVPEVPGEVRAVVTDFGLARAARDDDYRRVTAKDSMIGTPAYMAPEQVESGTITAATDIYALGVVLYEMLTGRYPFEAETALSTALKRLRETPTTPRSYVPHLPIRWEAAILRCLQREPEKRFATHREFVEALEGKRRVYPVRWTARRYGGWGAAALLVLATLWLVASRMGLNDSPGELPTMGGPSALEDLPTGRSADHDVGSFEARRSLALLGFRNLSGEPSDAWLATALAELLATEAAAGDRIRVVPGEKVARARLELGMKTAAEFDQGPMDRLAEKLESDLVVDGSYLAAGGANGREIRLDVQIREPAKGTTLARFSHRGTESAVLDLVEQVGRELRDALGVAAISAEEEAALRAVVPAGTEAVRLYAEGLDLLRRYEARAALERLLKASEIDPDNARIQTSISSAWMSLGYWPKARKAARQAFEQSANLPTRDRLWVEAQYFEISRKRQQAMENYSTLWDFFPDNLEYGIQLAKVKISMGKPDEAMDTVQQLRQLPPPSGEDPRIDLVEADAARALSLYPEQQRMAAAGAAKAAALEDRLLVARSREIEAAAWRDLGEPEKARGAYEEARSLYAATNNRGLVARVLVALAKLDRHLGNLERAKATLEEASRISEEIGDQGSLKHGLNTLAIILRQQGELRRAREMHLQELVANREIGDNRSEQITLTSLGVVERELGDLQEAEAHFAQALAIGREIRSQRSVAINLNLLGEVRLCRGDVAAAQRHFEQALAANEELGNRRGEAYYYTSLASVAMVRGDLATARRLHQRALDIRQDIGEQTNVANSQIALALIDLEEGLGEEASRRIRMAAEEFAREGKPQDEALALALLARAELINGRSDVAETTAERALEEVAEIENRGNQLRVWIATAPVVAAGGDAARARGLLRKAQEQAAAMDFVELRLKAGLELARLRAAAGDSTADAQRLDIAAEAEAFGFLLLAEQAKKG